jgi:hypothetical protein
LYCGGGQFGGRVVRDVVVWVVGPVVGPRGANGVELTLQVLRQYADLTLAQEMTCWVLDGSARSAFVSCSRYWRVRAPVTSISVRLR